MSEATLLAGTGAALMSLALYMQSYTMEKRRLLRLLAETPELSVLFCEFKVAEEPAFKSRTEPRK